MSTFRSLLPLTKVHAPDAFISGEFPLDLLVLLAESLLVWDFPAKAEWVLEMYDYLKPEPDRFQAQAYLVHCFE